MINTKKDIGVFTAGKHTFKNVPYNFVGMCDEGDTRVYMVDFKKTQVNKVLKLMDGFELKVSPHVTLLEGHVRGFSTDDPLSLKIGFRVSRYV